MFFFIFYVIFWMHFITCWTRCLTDKKLWRVNRNLCRNLTKYWPIENCVFDQFSGFLPKRKFLRKKNLILDFDFTPKLNIFVRKFWIFVQKFDFHTKLRFLTKINFFSYQIVNYLSAQRWGNCIIFFFKRKFFLHRKFSFFSKDNKLSSFICRQCFKGCHYLSARFIKLFSSFSCKIIWAFSLKISQFHDVKIIVIYLFIFTKVV